MQALLPLPPYSVHGRHCLALAPCWWPYVQHCAPNVAAPLLQCLKEGTRSAAWTTHMHSPCTQRRQSSCLHCAYRARLPLLSMGTRTLTPHRLPHTPLPLMGPCMHATSLRTVGTLAPLPASAHLAYDTSLPSAQLPALLLHPAARPPPDPAAYRPPFPSAPQCTRSRACPAATPPASRW